MRRFFYSREVHEKPLVVEGKPRNADIFRIVGDSFVGIHTIEVDLSSVLCGLFPGTIKHTLVEAVKRESETIDAGPPRAERPAQINQAKQRRHALEIEEEALISQTEEAGLSGFYRRHDCNPEIVLMKAG